MRTSLITTIGLAIIALTEARVHRRDVTTVTSMVTLYSTVCPCTGYQQPTTTLGYPVSTENPASQSMTTTTTTLAVPSTSSTVPPPPTTIPTTTTTTTTSSTSTCNGQTTQTLAAANLGDYITTVLYLHNRHRSNHTAQPLTWSPEQANVAAQIAASCVYAHNTSAQPGPYGQNIGAGFTPAQIGFMITNAMYNGEINNYPTPYGNDNPDLSNFGSWGHYSQIVWSDTTQVGCATQYCPNGLANTGPGVPPYFTVCNYTPPGNYLGEFSRVHAPQCQDSIVIV